MDEQRKMPRRRVLKAATIEFGGGTIDCKVRNISEAGAALDVVSPLSIPECFTLYVPTDQIKRRSRVIWRKEQRIGVSFE
ncbi:MAG: PilZ domain-containing protein [Rhodopseudomonas sp.]|uniref:PilZ domain-containing protein n=1 Tax=Rhodopseudomonas sp. TaxID=1078 RepID=UPI0039E2AD06